MVCSEQKNSGNRQILDIGFHDDKYLLEFVDVLFKDCEYFIETGTHGGSTLAYVAKTYPNIQCFSCELDRIAYEKAVSNTCSYTNVRVFNKNSQEFMKRIGRDYMFLFGMFYFDWMHMVMALYGYSGKKLSM